MNTLKFSGLLISSLALSIKIWILDQFGPQYVILTVIGLITFIYLAYKGYLDYFESIRKKRMMMNYSTTLLNTALSLIPNKEKPKKTINSNLVEEIHIERHGRKHVVYVPYDSSLVSEMIKYKVYLVKGNNTIDITHPPGISHMVSAYHLDGDKIIVKDKVSGKTVKEYEEADIPCFYDFSFDNCPKMEKQDDEDEVTVCLMESQFS